jgi:hypothetical protein
VNATEMLALLRLNTLLEDTAPDYGDVALLRELNDALTTKFQRMVLDARRGYWLHYVDYQLTAGTKSVRLPPRATSISKVQIGTGTSSTADFQRLPQVDDGHSEVFEGARSSVGRPQCWFARGDRVHLSPAADSGGYVVRVWYYIRPSWLVPAPNNDNGRITAINTTTRVLTVNLLPVDQLLSSPTFITSGNQRIDVVHPDGWHELALVGAPQTYSGVNITVGGSDPLDEISVGDYVRVADQSEWPPIPDDFHRCVVDIATVKILIQRDYQAKAVGFASDVGTDMQRFGAIIANRVREEPRVVRAPLPSLRRRRMV